MGVTSEVVCGLTRRRAKLGRKDYGPASGCTDETCEYFVRLGVKILSGKPNASMHTILRVSGGRVLIETQISATGIIIGPHTLEMLLNTLDENDMKTKKKGRSLYRGETLGFEARYLV